ncbi:MAG: Fur family transcriptional regulator [Rhodospirillaceae bacterium]
MNEKRYAQTITILNKAGLRPTKQRIALGDRLFGSGNRHVTAEALYSEANQLGVKVSLATVYNTLHQFCKVGLLREVLVGPGNRYFDTNTSPHHHFYFQDSGRIADIAPDEVSVSKLPCVPSGLELAGIEIVVRVVSTDSDPKTKN